MSNLKVEGKVADFCPKCKNCKSTTRECDGEKDWLTEVECEDPYDGMIKTLAADSDICCSMFAPKPDRACDKISLLQHELEMDRLRKKIHQLEKEKVAHLKGIERLKKSNNGIKDKYKKLETRIDELIKASKRKDELIQNYREKLKKENEAGSKIVEENVKLENIYFMPSQVNVMIDNVKRQKDIERNAAVNGLRVQIKQLELGYEELKIENEQRKKAMDNQSKMIQDLEKERDELAEKLKNTDISKVAKFQSNINFQIAELHNKETEYDYEYERCEHLIDKIKRAEARIKNLKHQIEETQKELDKKTKINIEVTAKLLTERDKLKNEIISLNTINKGLAEDLRSAKDKLNYLYFKAKEFTNMED